MTGLKYSAAAVPVALLTFAGAAMVAPVLSHAAQCGPGTVYDAATDTCVLPPAAPAEWNTPPPPPAPPSVLPPGMQPVQICPPIPFVAVCFPIK